MKPKNYVLIAQQPNCKWHFRAKNKSESIYS